MENPWDNPYEYAQLFCERELLIVLVDEQQFSFDRLTNHPKLSIYPEEVILMAARNIDKKGLVQFHESVEDQVFDIRYFDKVTIDGLSVYTRIKSNHKWVRHVMDCERMGIHPRNALLQPYREE